MRANISFSVDVDGIPTELARLIDHESDEINGKCWEVVECLNNSNFTKARELLLEARQTLGNADIRLHEIDQILSGYINIVNEPTEEVDAVAEEE